MTLRVLPCVFFLKPLGCLATDEQKKRENENFTNFSDSSAVLYFLSRCVLKANIKFIDYLFILFRMAYSDFLKVAPLLRFVGHDVKITYFLNSNFIQGAAKVRKQISKFPSTKITYFINLLFFSFCSRSSALHFTC